MSRRECQFPFPRGKPPPVSQFAHFAPQSAVADLFSFRDLYFESHPVSEAALKSGRVEAKLGECCEVIDAKAEAAGDKVDARARLLYNRGRAMNVRGEHSPEAESLLSKAVKLDPAMVEAWNELGEAHWKRGDIDTAKTCFEGAVRLVTLRRRAV